MTDPAYQHNRDAMQRKMSLIQELDITIALIESGLAVLQRSRMFNTKHFVFLLLLTSGIERLMKIILTLHHLETEGSFLTRQELRQLGHNLRDMCNSIMTRCFTPGYRNRPIAAADYQFIEQDPMFHQLLDIMADFAMNRRYAYMDGTDIPTHMFNAPDRLWEEVEIQQIPPERIRDLLDSDESNTVKHQAVNNLVICIERFIRALCRLFALAELGGQARALSPTVKQFAQLNDADLGKRMYEL